MNIKYVKEDNFILYIPKTYYKYDNKTIDEFIKKLIKILNNRYDIEIYSIFNIKCYIDNNYGIILEIEIESDSFSIYSKRSEINLEKINTNMFYEIEDYIDEDIIIKNNKLCISSDKNINMEFIVDIIYKNAKI